MTSVAFIGAGRLGATLAKALSRHGMPVVAIASRSATSATALAQEIPGCRAVNADIAAEADLVFLTVPDDEIGPLAARLPWRAGQRVVHCSGATEVAVLEPAQRRGALTGGFHPLQIFSDPDRALGLLAGSSVAIEGPAVLEAQLRQIADALQMRVIVLPAGARALYHGAASFAASFLLSMLDEAVAVWGSFGIDEKATLQALLPLARGTLAAAESKGLAGALAGPVSRGDASVVARHVAVLDALGPAHGALYRELARRQIALARTGGRVNEERLEALREAIGRPLA
ncbi:Rossmann-like and DUF2520 domain-containing protein [Piscinibacter sp.]|uniref:Rossmann-like and DUF2520 domain-containing protein n=1 Tax=Piscinibacter sp. TaxID=1903157 RepID=UPI002C5F05CD|nr:DUF2520 domain-containing protein [Albitalea sp.]HUG22627.1 DUF2520 domain-containing protein [Albitalea sp.]